MRKTTRNIGTVNVPEGCFPEEHERATAELLKAAGKDITFLIPRRQPGFHTPDIMMDGKYWEIKCPIGISKKALELKIKDALKQSENIIIDLRQSKINNNIAVNVLLHHTTRTGRIKTLLIIEKNCEILVAKGKFVL